MKEKKYGYAVEMYHLPADMGGGLMATIPELPGCVGVGYSMEEALGSVSKMAETLHKQADTAPVTLSGNVQRKLLNQAAQAGISVDELVANLLSSYSDLMSHRLIALTE